MKYVSVALDGPSGAGKSTMARQLAQALGYLYVDTGAIYRTLGLSALENGVDLADRDRITALLARVRIKLCHGPDGLQHMELDGRDVSEDIRLPQVSKAASVVSAIPEVRAFLLDMQRDLAAAGDVVMDGRDIGTVVLPNASVKIFLTASAQERANRRYQELLARGAKTDFDTVLRDIEQRDHSDTTRDTAPLRQAEDAVLVDTTGVSLDASLTILIETVRKKLDL